MTKMTCRIVLIFAILGGNLKAESITGPQIAAAIFSGVTAGLSAPGAYFARKANNNLESYNEDGTNKRVAQRCLTGSEGLYWYVTASAGLSMILSFISIDLACIGGLVMLPASLGSFVGLITEAIAFGVQDNTEVQLPGNNTAWGSSDSDLKTTFGLGMATWIPAIFAAAIGIASANYDRHHGRHS